MPKPRFRKKKIFKWMLISLIVLSCGSALFLHLFAGPRGIPDGWRPVIPAPAALSEKKIDVGFEVKPTIALVDVSIEIRGTRLEPHEDVIVRASMTDAKDRLFTSWARFRADSSGKLDLSTTPPIEGSYIGASSNGLLWSMRSKEDTRFATSSDWSQRDIQLQMETSRGVQTKTITRVYPWSELHQEVVSGSGVEGQLWLPRGEQPLPVIIKLGGWGDGPSPLSSSLMAARGFAVLDLGYHDRENLPEELVSIPIETITRAVDWLSQHPRIDRTRIGLFGVSKGAELVLWAAAHEPRVNAVVAWTPASVAFSGISFRDTDPGSSWSYEGTDIPYAAPQVSVEGFRNAARFILRRPVSFRTTYLSALENAADETRIPVEKISGPILFAAGTDDQMWPASEMVSEMVARLEREQFAHRVESVIVEGAGHFLDYSLWPAGGGPTRYFVRGGNPDSNHRAGEQAWRKSLNWFEEILKRKSADTDAGSSVDADFHVPAD